MGGLSCHRAYCNRSFGVFLDRAEKETPFSLRDSVVRPPGFEPGFLPWQGNVLDQARLRPQGGYGVLDFVAKKHFS